MCECVFVSLCRNAERGIKVCMTQSHASFLKLMYVHGDVRDVIHQANSDWLVERCLCLGLLQDHWVANSDLLNIRLSSEECTLVEPKESTHPCENVLSHRVINTFMVFWSWPYPE